MVQAKKKVDAMALEVKVRQAEEDLLAKILKMAKRNVLEIDEADLVSEIHNLAEYVVGQSYVLGQDLPRVEKMILSPCLDYVWLDPTILSRLSDLAKVLFETGLEEPIRCRSFDGLQPKEVMAAFPA